MQAHKHTSTTHSDSHKHIPHDLDSPPAYCEDPITLQCLQVQQGPQGRQASRLCLCTHTCPACQEKWPPRSPGDAQCGAPARQRTLCEYHLAWPDCRQIAANRQYGGGQCVKWCSEVLRTTQCAPHGQFCIYFGGLLTQGEDAFFVYTILKRTIYNLMNK